MPTRISVVIAEDEWIVRTMSANILRDEGFEVLEAVNALEALVLLREHAHVDVLFTDIHMPGDMDGLELAHQASRSWPWLSFIIASGRASPSPAELPANSRFLSKPYYHDSVIGHIRELTAA